MRRHRRLGAALGGFVLLLAFVRSSSAVRRWTDGGPAPGTAAAAATPAQQQRSHRSQGFYVQPGTEHLVAAAKEDTREVTDKVSRAACSNMQQQSRHALGPALGLQTL